ncbi:MAG: hypothetical protein A2085_10895 [Gemmatimonadetes bacterium GWC2_71_10]|nr:MAG: hypothetical protein A2085_10895 [Gemmatimonadetes bacterium GWC2_71_10]
MAAGAPDNRGVRGRDIGGVGSVGVPTRRQVEPGTGTPANTPLIRGETGRRGTNQPDDRRGVDRRNDEPGGQPRPNVIEKPQVRDIARPQRQEPGIDESTRRGVYRQPEAQRGEPRQAEPRREAASPPRSEPRPQAAEPRSEPRAQPQPSPRAEPRQSSPPPRSEPAPRLERRRPDSDR